MEGVACGAHPQQVPPKQRPAITGRGTILSSGPKRRDRASSNNQCAADQNRDSWHRSKSDEGNQLPDHKESGNVEPDDAPEIKRRRIEKRTIAQQQYGTCEKQP